MGNPIGIHSNSAIVLNPASLDFSSGTPVLSPWSKHAVQRVFGDSMWPWDNRTLAWRTIASNYPTVCQVLSTNSFGTIDRVPQWQTVVWSELNLPKLRAEQLDAVIGWSRERRGVIVMPTGTGKTEVAMRIMAGQRCSTLIVAPIRDLIVPVASPNSAWARV